MFEVPIKSPDTNEDGLIDGTDSRRVAPRQPVEWTAKYRFHGSPAERWRNCRIVDISTAGGGLRLYGINAEEADDRAIDLLVELRGEIRSSIPGMKKDVRAGVEFLELSGDAAKFIDALKRSGTRW